MSILVGLSAGAALLYFWLRGHWFARILVFLPIGVFGFVAGSNVAPTYMVVALIFGAIGVIAAWFISGLPIYYWRHKIAGLMRIMEYH